MGTYISNNPTLAAIGRVGAQGENNTTPYVVTEKARIDRLKAAQPFTGTPHVAGASNDFKQLFGNLNVNLNCPRIKSEFTREQLCGAHVLADKLDVSI